MAEEPTPTPDFSAVARRPSERLTMVRYIVESQALQETDYLEWKTGYDLSTKVGAGKAAKHLIGFANREVERAARFAEGHAYLVLGAEPGRLVGVENSDSADIENWIAPFVGPDLVYDVHHIGVDGATVLMLVVAPPKAGDPIFALQRSTGDETVTLREGTIYVRHASKTEQATAADIAALTSRAKAETSALALSVEVDGSRLIPFQRELLTPEFRVQHLDRARELRLKSLPEESSLGLLIRTPIGEHRTHDEYREEVTQFIHKTAQQWVKYVTFMHIEANDPSAAFFVVNETDDNFEDVVVEVEIPLPRPLVHRSVGDAADELELPEDPGLWGAGAELNLRPVFESAIPAPAEPSIEAAANDRTTARFPPVHAYPHSRHELGSLTLGLQSRHAGLDLPVKWRATAKNTRGVVRGTTSMRVLGPTDIVSDEDEDP